MYVLAFRQKRDPSKPLYYRKYEFCQDSPTEGSWTIFRTIYLADAKTFGTVEAAQEELERFGWSPGWSIEYVIEDEYRKSEREKFKDILANEYIGTLRTRSK